ncbi:SAM hydroxide adenosyltransferase [Tundrisphaera lichenicola]|uniref:SAM hydroxide adenosyltransferase n=1 Tax=Tundrisphaera lichenicola TaxID=2029860 RepID=UPI003EBA3A4E
MIELGDGFRGEVVFTDHFGNLITNLTREHLCAGPDRDWTIEIDGHTIEGLVRVYADRSPGTLVGLIGSNDRLEVAVVNGNAARFLNASRGIEVRLRRNPEITS